MHASRKYILSMHKTIFSPLFRKKENRWSILTPFVLPASPLTTGREKKIFLPHFPHPSVYHKAHLIEITTNHINY